MLIRLVLYLIISVENRGPQLQSARYVNSAAAVDFDKLGAKIADFAMIGMLPYS